MDKKVLIVVLSWNHLSFTRLCLKYLYKNTNKKHEILVVDQGSDKETLEFLRNEKDLYNIRLVENGTNIGISAGINLGIDIALENNYDLCFFSNDCVPGHDWLENLQEEIYRYDCVGGGSPYIGPEATYDDFINMQFRENYRRNVWPRLRQDPTAYELESIIDDLHGGNFQEFTENWTETRKEVPPLFEWFSMIMYIKLSTLKKIGKFDIRYFPSHYEDLDYMVRMNNEELYRIGVSSSYCFHFSTITTRSEFKDGDPELNRLANDSERKFNEKWRIFLPYAERKNGVPDGDKYEPKEVVPFLPFEVSEKHQNRHHNKWYTWQEWDKLNRYSRILCEKCGWHEDNVAMKPKCPDCGTEGYHIRLLRGSLKEIEEYTLKYAK